MAGVAMRTNCNKTEINELNKIINGQYRDSIKKRAKCIILSSQGVLNKNIAAEVDLTPRLVGNWVRRYNESGINGLFDVPKPGRAGAKRANSDLGDRIRAKLTENPPPGQETWTAQSLGDALGVSVYIIWRTCRELDIPLQRPRSWSYDTFDELSSKQMDIVGLFCTLHEKAIVIKINTGLDNTVFKGRFQTHSKDIANEIDMLRKQKSHKENGSDSVTLTDVLAIATEHVADQRRYKAMHLYEFLNDIMDELPSISGCNYMVIYYSLSKDAFHGLGKAGYSFTSAGSHEDWLRRAETLIKSQCNTSEDELLLTNGINKYVNAMVESTEPFIWWKHPAGNEENRTVEATEALTETKASSTGDKPSVKHESDGKPKVEITFSYTDENGKITAQTASVTEGLLHTSDCDLSSTDSIAGFVENLTNHTLPLLDLAAQKIGTFALDAVKKNNI